MGLGCGIAVGHGGIVSRLVVTWFKYNEKLGKIEIHVIYQLLRALVFS